MSKLRIVVDTDSLEWNPPGNVWGILYVELDGIAFPGDSWSDVCSSVLSMWCQGVSELLVGSTDRKILPFVDGHYSMVLQISQNCPVSFWNVKDESILDGVIDLRYFARQLLSGAEKVLTRFPDASEEHWFQELKNRSQDLRRQLHHSKVISS